MIAFESSWIKRLKIPVLFVLTIWIVHLVTYLLNLDLGQYGVYPRRFFGLRGILFSPLIHSDFGHLISNTTPLLVLSALIVLFYRRVAIPAFLMIYFFSGLAVWAFARPAFHIGASGFIYGLVTFVLWTGIFRRNIKSIALALIVVFYYGSMIFGILPLREGISWEGHLFGALSGILASYWFMDLIEPDEEKKLYSWQREAEQPKQYFLPRDTFDNPKSKRLFDTDEKEDDSFWTSNHT